MFSYSIAVVNVNFVLCFENFDWKKFMKGHFYAKNPSINQGKTYTFLIWTQGKSAWQQQKLKENLGKIKIKNCCEPCNTMNDCQVLAINGTYHMQ